jgi:hypothetical protein
MAIRKFILRTAFFLPVVIVAVPDMAVSQPREVVRGTLRVVKTKHPNGTPIRALQLVSAGNYFFER